MFLLYGYRRQRVKSAGLRAAMPDDGPPIRVDLGAILNLLCYHSATHRWPTD